MAESDNILTKLQDLLVYLIPQLNKVPRDQKFVLGDRIETKLLDVQGVQGSNRTNVILFVSVLICWEVLVNYPHAAHVTRRISGCDLPCREPGQSAGGCFSG